MSLYALFTVISVTALVGNLVHAAENDHGLVYHVWFPPPGPDDPAQPPLTVQDQVRYCSAAEEWSRRIWEVTDGSHLIYQVHFFSGYEDPPSAEVTWQRGQGLPNANCNGKCFFMADFLKSCSKVFDVEGGELTAHLECLGENQVCSSEDADDARTAFCQQDGEAVETPLDEIGWVLAHENAHSHYNLLDEYVPDSSAAVYSLFHVCVGTPDNQGTEQTSMMAKRLRNHWCDSNTHVSERPIRDIDDNILLDDEGNPFLASTSRHSDGVWQDALQSEWQKHALEYSSNYDNVPAFPGLPIPHLESGNPVEFCKWHFQGDGQPINDALVLLDKSGSMEFQHPAFEDGPTALEAAGQSAVSFYNSVRDDRLAGIFAFDSGVIDLVPYGPKGADQTDLGVSAGGSTNLCEAIRVGANTVKSHSPSADFGGAQQILLSDGRPTVAGCDSDAEVLLAAMDACDGGLEGVGVATNTVAFGDADRELLRQVAEVCGARTTALQVATSPLEIDGETAQGSTPLQIRTALARSGRFARGYSEVLHHDAALASVRNDSFVVPPGTSELIVEWMGDGFEHLFFSDLGATSCRFGSLEFQLVRPDGTTVSESESPVPDELDYLSRTLRVAAPEPGLWQARITPEEIFICYPGFAGTRTWGDYDPRVTAVASLRAADISPRIELSPTVAPRDVPVRLTTSIFMAPNARLTNISATAAVTDQGGTSEAFALFDDGTHGDEVAADGIYTGTFNEDRAEMDSGGYRVAVTLESNQNAATPVYAGEAGLEIAAGPLPSAPRARFSLEDSFVYRDCELGNGLAGNTCGDDFAIPTDPSPEDPCSISLPPGDSRRGISVETRGLPLGTRGVRVTAGEGVRIRNVRTVSYDPESKHGLVRFDAEATAYAPDRPRHVHVSFAGRSVSSNDCRPPVEARFEYAAKLVCGTQKDTRNMQLARGFYATTINLRNPDSSAVTFEKTLSLSIPPGRQRPGKVLPIAIDTLRPGESLAVDCDDVRDRVFGGTFPASFIEGYVVIRSPRSLDVNGVYTTATLNAEGTAEDHSSIHVEPIRERRIKGKKPPDGEAKQADLIPVPGTPTHPIQPETAFCQLDASGRLLVRVRNQGEEQAQASVTSVTFSFDNTPILQATAALGPAGDAVDETLVPFSLPRRCFSGGGFDVDCPFRIQVDSGSEVTESNEGNNAANGVCLKAAP